MVVENLRPAKPAGRVIPPTVQPDADAPNANFEVLITPPLRLKVAAPPLGSVPSKVYAKQVLSTPALTMTVLTIQSASPQVLVLHLMNCCVVAPVGLRYVLVV
ncbi:unannotated protein [freshwater metagenome]|uniref:Unannotated protein n=1 Tax=freshwater metagenome TaxID=449393 RepID=A0A6J7U5S8_9ZZZZ